jgi:amidase
MEEMWQGAVVCHVLTRTLRDSAAMLDACQGLGHKVEEAQPEIAGHAIARSFLLLYFSVAAGGIEWLKTILGRKPRASDVEPLTRTMVLLGRAHSAGEFVAARREWGVAAKAMARFHEKYDLYLTPTMACPPPRIGEFQPKPYERFLLKVVNTLGLGRMLKISGIADRMAMETLSQHPFTFLANLTGQPAMSVPLHWIPDGLPCGVHFMARFGDEGALLRLAGQLERARPWFERHGRVWAE